MVKWSIFIWWVTTKFPHSYGNIRFLCELLSISANSTHWAQDWCLNRGRDCKTHIEMAQVWARAKEAQIERFVFGSGSGLGNLVSNAIVHSLRTHIGGIHKRYSSRHRHHCWPASQPAAVQCNCIHSPSSRESEYTDTTLICVPRHSAVPLIPCALWQWMRANCFLLAKNKTQRAIELAALMLGRKMKCVISAWGTRDASFASASNRYWFRRCL